VIFVDTSAVIAFLADEPDAATLAAKLEADPERISAGHVVLEASMRLATLLDITPTVASGLIMRLIREADIAVVPITEPIHFVGIGGIGMSGIAEVLASISATPCRARTPPRTPTSSACARRAPGRVGHAPRISTAPRWSWSRRDQARQSGTGRGAREAAAGRAPRRDAGRADAAQERRRGRRHARQDHDHVAGRGAARRRRLRSDRDQWRHHQRLRHQCAARRSATGWWWRPTSPTAPS
jgi:ribonuclease VapC